MSVPGDRFEREADAAADTVMRMEHPAQSIPASAAGESTCAMSNDEETTLQAQPLPTASTGAVLDAEDAASVAERGGDPLPKAVRSFFEPRFGHDFRRIRLRVHGEAARAMQARAYTIGPNIVFAHGEYTPCTADGTRLLAHELAHTIQQGAAPRLDGSTQSSLVRSPGPMIQRDLAAYGRQHVELLPYTEPSSPTTYTTESADASRLQSALATLISAGKVGTRTVGDTVVFYNSSATATELEVALASFRRGREMAAKLLDAHNVWLYSRESLTQVTTLFWTSTLARQEENLAAQNRRRLTNYERTQALRVFANSLALDDIVLEEDPIMSVGGYARTTPWTINFPRGSYGGSGFMKWLIHELTHSWQYQHGVSLATTFYHALGGHYDYGGEAGLVAAQAAGRRFRSFTTEQQASIVEDYWERLNAGRNVTAWQPFIDQLRNP